MKKLNVLTAVFLAGLMMAGCSQNETINSADEEMLSLKSASVSGKYIVVLKEDAGLIGVDLQVRNSKVKEKASGLLKKYEVTGEVEEVFETALQGFTVKMAPGQAKKMAGDGFIKFVEADQVISLSPVVVKGKPGLAPQPVQRIPWGITRVGGSGDGTGKTAWVIDTGIDLTHPDLNVDAIRSALFWVVNLLLGTKTVMGHMLLEPLLQKIMKLVLSEWLPELPLFRYGCLTDKVVEPIQELLPESTM